VVEVTFPAIPGGGPGAIEVFQDSHCVTDMTLEADPDPNSGNFRLTINEGWFGVSDGGGGGGSYYNYIDVYVYQDKWIKPFFQPEYGEPWQDELIYDGHEVVGVRWTAPKGEFLEAGEKYQMYVTSTCMPDPFLDYYAHDASTDRMVYFNLYARPSGSPLLGSDRGSLSAATGGTIDFTLCAGLEHANKSYALLGGVSGTSPGTPLPGGLATLPLNVDPFTDLVLAMINSPVFANFLGSLDGASTSTAQLKCGPLPPELIGLKMYFAYTFYNPFDCVSNHLEAVIAQ
jgi:hypothetical protein